MTFLEDGLVDTGLLEPIDISFGKMLARHATDHAEPIACAGALCSAATRAGETCVELEALVTARFGPDNLLPVSLGCTLSKEEWLAALRASSCVSDGSRVAPLVLDSSSRLYLYRMWRAQMDVAQRLTELSATFVDEEDNNLDEAIDRLVPRDSMSVEQIEAIKTVAQRAFTVITGGPGTGKTTTLARALLVLLDRDRRFSRRQSRIALLAPTGKAAARMAEAVARAIVSLADSADARPLLDSLPARASTVHRALVDAGRDGLIVADVVAVDESSMLDLELFSRLLAALPSKTRLVLIGDANQLSSVEAGSVLSDIVRGAKESSSSPISSCVVRLTSPHRFSRQGGIASVAQSVLQGDSERTLRLLEHEESARLHVPDGKSAEEIVLDLLSQEIEAYANARDPLERLDLLERTRVLCAHRRGPSSCESVGHAIETELREKFEMPMRGSWYKGRPILVRSNDSRLGLSNGDVGVVDAIEHRVSVVFRGSTSARSLAPTQIRDYETTYAMTVHKAQGSEFERVVVVLPHQGSKALTRELLYTAVTRAKARIDVVAQRSAIRAACDARVVRASGLAELLAAPAARRKELGA